MKKYIIIIIIMLSAFSSNAVSEHSFFDGSKWTNISSDFPSIKDLNSIKDLYARACEGTSLLLGKPSVIYTNSNKRMVLEKIDSFYNDKSNDTLPLYFIFKMIAMQKKGFSQAQTAKYASEIKRSIGI